MKKLLLILLFFAAATVFADAQTKKFQGEFNLGHSLSLSPCINVQAIYGIRLSNHFFTGLGVGGDFFYTQEGMIALPVFLNAKSYLSTRKKSVPYFSLDLGYGFGVSESMSGLGEIMWSPAFGWRGQYLSFQIGYLNQRILDEDGYYMPFNGLQIKLGFNF
ncbi:MAG: hypothetical protein ACI3Y2_03555 [Candidatus Egerieousia sp.]